MYSKEKLPFPECFLIKFLCNTPITMIMMTDSKTIIIIDHPTSPPIIAGNGIPENEISFKLNYRVYKH